MRRPRVIGCSRGSVLEQAKEQAKVQEQQTIQLRPHIEALIGERDEVRRISSAPGQN
jgi:hypothetical protein